MKKNPTLVEKATELIPEFRQMDYQIHMKLYIHGRSASTYKNYVTHLAAITLHFKKLPTHLTQTDIEDYLFYLKNHQQTYSLSYFKHTVYALRLIFELYNLHHLHVILPYIKKITKMPVVLSRSEVLLMINTPKLFSHQVMIAVLYSCGLRCSELINLRTEDIDFERNVLYVQPGKNKRDRILPLGEVLPKMLKEYIHIHHPANFLFKGVMNRKYYSSGRKFSGRALQTAVHKASKMAGIKKHVHVHTLRHTFATHLLEDGIDIGTIQKFMGHHSIKTTLIYIHVAQYEKRSDYNLFDQLQGVRKKYAQQMLLNFG